MAKAKRGRPKGSIKKKPVAAVKKDEEYEVVIYQENPNCPCCNNRNYNIIDYGMKDDLVKFYAKCKVCRTNFIYCKSIASVFKRSDNNENGNTRAN
jgi:hypothetical protein